MICSFVDWIRSNNDLKYRCQSEKVKKKLKKTVVAVHTFRIIYIKIEKYFATNYLLQLVALIL